MAGLPCAKEIIDKGAAMAGDLQCLTASVALAATADKTPSFETRDKWLAAEKRLKQLVAATLAEVGL